jgi:anoctamin-10
MLGNYLFKQFTEDHSDWDWICNDTQPKDFTTLMRNTIMVKLCRDAHMHVRSFLSSDGKFIFVVIKS